MNHANWRSLNPEETPGLWFFLCILGWSLGPALIINIGRELTLFGNTSLLNFLLVGAGVLCTAVAFSMLIKARRAAGIGVGSQAGSGEDE